MNTATRILEKPACRLATAAALDRGESAHASAHASATAPLARLLEELADVVAGLSDEQYATKPVGVIPSSVGGHVRHCLDHVTALLASVASGRLDYDRRERGTDVETDRGAALAAIRRLARDVESLPPGAPARALRVSVLMTSDGPAAQVLSSLGRELAYVQSHIIHHNAIVAAIVKTQGGQLPDRFGYAPATIRHMGGPRGGGPAGSCQVAACAR